MLRSCRIGSLSHVLMLRAAASAPAAEASKVAPAAVWGTVAVAMAAPWVAATTDSSTSPTLV